MPRDDEGRDLGLSLFRRSNTFDMEKTGRLSHGNILQADDGK
jgi:hypothetical protein